MEKRWLSKSQINLFRQCPCKWKLIYIDGKEPVPSPAMQRGSGIHEEIEHFYKNIDLVKIDGRRTPVIVPKKDMNRIRNFLEFEKKRIVSCIDRNGKFDEKYFRPVFQELYVENKELMLRGYIDAVYINPKDDGVIIIDWKTGKYRKNNLNDYRFELAIYKELLERSGKIEGEVKYWGIYFVDQNKLFFEKAESKYVKRMFIVVEEVRKQIENGEYKCKPSILCRWCEFSDECEVWK